MSYFSISRTLRVACPRPSLDSPMYRRGLAACAVLSGWTPDWQAHVDHVSMVILITMFSVVNTQHDIDTINSARAG